MTVFSRGGYVSFGYVHGREVTVRPSKKGWKVFVGTAAVFGPTTREECNAHAATLPALCNIS